VPDEVRPVAVWVDDPLFTETVKFERFGKATSTTVPTGNTAPAVAVKDVTAADVLPPEYATVTVLAPETSVTVPVVAPVNSEFARANVVDVAVVAVANVVVA